MSADPIAEKLEKAKSQGYDLKGILPEKHPPKDNWKTAREFTYTTFSGADLIVSLNEYPVGAINSISWHKTYGPQGRVEGKLAYTIFHSDSLEELFYGREYNTFSLTFANEYGGAMHYSIVGVQFTSRSFSCSMDDIVTEEIYTFTADDVVGMQTVAKAKGVDYYEPRG